MAIDAVIPAPVGPAGALDAADPTARESAVLAGQLFEAALRCGELMSGYLGLELGLYRALRDRPGTAAVLAARAGVHERYAREWLEQQAACGIVAVDDLRRPADGRTFRLPSGHADALLDADSLHYAAPMALLPVGALAGSLTVLAEAYRAGAGVDPQRLSGFHGSGLSDGLYRARLRDWVSEAAPAVHGRLATAPAPRIADIACGTGSSTLALADAYPSARVDGFDIDRASIAAANARLADRPDLAARVRFHVADVTAMRGESGYDLVCLLDSLHDMPRPVEALSRCHDLLTGDGCALLLEPRAADRFTAPADLVERFLYVCSLLHCLPIGMSEPHTAATGAVMRPATLRGYAARAGFSALHVLAGGSRLHRLYRLDP